MALFYINFLHLLFLEVKKLLAIPLIPINRPLNQKKITIAKPIREPPKKADEGVKFEVIIYTLHIYHKNKN